MRWFGNSGSPNGGDNIDGCARLRRNYGLYLPWLGAEFRFSAV
jgi:hypothetical protein